MALQEVVRALSHDAVAALDLVGLLTDMAADHTVDVSHVFEDAGAFLLERRREHNLGSSGMFWGFFIGPIGGSGKEEGEGSF